MNLWDVPQFISLYRQEVNIDFVLRFFSPRLTASSTWGHPLKGPKTLIIVIKLDNSINETIKGDSKLIIFLRSSGLFAPLFFSKPMFPIRWLPAAVHDGQYQNIMILDAIKNGVRKASGEATSNVFINHTI